MVFWIVAAFLTLAATLSVLLPLARRGEAGEAASHDVEVYRHQLRELEREAESGLIGPAEAVEARAEIGRRLLKAAEEAKREKARRADTRLARLVGAAAVLAVPLVSWGLYAGIGSPHLPAQPLAARQSPQLDNSSLAELVARAERHLAANPSDGRGWDVLAPIYLRMGRYEEALTAFRNATRILGASAARKAGEGEALAAQAGGLVTMEAQRAFEEALELEPGSAKARYFLAMAAAQEGRRDEAAEAWRALRRDLPADSPWQGAITAALSGLEDVPAGPSAEDVEAAASLSPQERMAMVEGMVAQLDARLREEPHDLEGWQHLMRSYAVLGRHEAAQQARRRAIETFGAESPEARLIDQLAAALGLGGGGASNP
jgi:cytochrome c-type biogenesis protein CcmH